MVTEPDSEGAYEIRYVAFLDLLGFREMVKKSVRGDIEPVALAEILRWQERAKSDSKDWGNLVDHMHEGDPRGITVMSRPGDDRDSWQTGPAPTELVHCSAFSDSICVSAHNSGSGLVGIGIVLAFFIQQLLLQHGVFVRGAVVKGGLHHEKDILFGPGLVEAYDLECSHAIYPRVLVSAIVRYDLEFFSNHGGSVNMALREDCDGFHHMDVLHRMHSFTDPPYDALERVRSLLAEKIKSTTDKHVQEKVAWYARYFNETILRDGIRLAPLDMSPLGQS